MSSVFEHTHIGRGNAKGCRNSGRSCRGETSLVGEKRFDRIVCDIHESETVRRAVLDSRNKHGIQRDQLVATCNCERRGDRREVVQCDRRVIEVPVAAIVELHRVVASREAAAIGGAYSHFNELADVGTCVVVVEFVDPDVGGAGRLNCSGCEKAGKKK